MKGERSKERKRYEGGEVGGDVRDEIDPVDQRRLERLQERRTAEMQVCWLCVNTPLPFIRCI